MKEIVFDYFPLICAIVGWALAQLLKPIMHYFIAKEFKASLIVSSGGLPSSHSAAICALTLAVGIVNNFHSTLFCVTVVIASIICYDAANVRYYAGQNISLTKRLITDLKTVFALNLKDPIYEKKMKEVLGHTYFEVFAGIITGFSTTGILYLIYRGIYG